MQHKFGALDLIRAGLQDLDRARTLFDELHNDGIDDDRMRLLLATLEKACDPDIALSNLVDIIKVMQSQGKDFTNIIADENSFVRLITVLGVSDEMGKLMRFRPELVEAAANDACESHLYNHEQRRAHVLKSVGADPNDHTMPTASLPLAEAATALRKTYRKQLAAIMAQDATANDPIEIQPRISTELSDLADAALEGALAIARHEVDGSEHVRFAIIGMGKLGAQELNYVSDVDLIYVVEPPTWTPTAWHSAESAPKWPPRCNVYANPSSWASQNRHSGRSTVDYAPKARTVRWYADSNPTEPITSNGRKTGNSRPCSKPAR